MSIYVVRDTLTEIHARLSSGHVSHLRIITPFLRRSAIEKLIPRGLASIRLISRFALRDFLAGSSEIDALDCLLARPASVRGIQDLHAKVYIVDDRYALVTSANLTTGGLERNLELGVGGTDERLVSGAIAFFEHLWESATPDLTAERLAELRRGLHSAEARFGVPRATSGLRDYGAVCPRLTAIDASQCYVKFFARGPDRVERRSRILDLLHRSGCHWACTYPTGKRPRSVRTGSVMYMGFLVKNPNDVLIFGRGVAHKYVRGRDDASSADIRRRSWKRNFARYIRISDPVFLAGSLDGGISLNQLMNEMGHESFVSTARNMSQGSGNTNPRLAIRQQPAVKLTGVAAEWLARHFDFALATCGRLADDDMRDLDWPEGDLID